MFEKLLPEKEMQSALSPYQPQDVVFVVVVDVDVVVDDGHDLADFFPLQPPVCPTMVCFALVQQVLWLSVVVVVEDLTLPEILSF